LLIPNPPALPFKRGKAVKPPPFDKGRLGGISCPGVFERYGYMIATKAEFTMMIRKLRL
jgi:hypothetical protein